MLALVFGLAAPARAQAPLYGFTGFGASLGGGATRVRGTFSTPIGPLIQPPGTSGSLAAGAHLLWGTRRWAVMLPDAHVHAGSGGEQTVPGAVTLGTASIPFESTSRSASVWVVLGGVQVAVAPSHRAWVRAGLGGGGVSSRVESDSGVGIDLGEDLGLAWSTAAGVSVWQRRLSGGDAFTSLDVEVHYLRVNGEAVRLTMPSLRVGWRVQAARR